MTNDRHLNMWVIELPDGSIDGGYARFKPDGTEISKEEALSILCPHKADLLAWATSDARLQLGTRQEVFGVVGP